MTARDVDRLVQDASIIRNRGKIQATVDNAPAMLSASPSLVALASSYEFTRKRAPRSVADLPKSTPQAEAFAKQLKAQGVPVRRPHERVRVHAERRRGQRPRPRVFPRSRLPHHGPNPLKASRSNPSNTPVHYGYSSVDGWRRTARWRPVLIVDDAAPWLGSPCSSSLVCASPGSVDSLPVRLRPRWKDQHRACSLSRGVPWRRHRGGPSGRPVSGAGRS
jgi:hypothetical protein